MIIDVAELRVLVETYYDIQHMRLIAENRIRAAVRVRGLSEAKAKVLEDWTDERLCKQESELKAMVQKQIKHHPLWATWLKDVKGIGPCICGGLLAWVGDIGKFDTVSKLWAYAGLHVIDGHAAKRTKGEKANWSDNLKVLAWKAAQSFVMVGDGYRELYLKEKTRLRVLHPEPVPYDPPRFKRLKPGQTDADRELLSQYSDGHIDNMAKRWVAKLFLSHVWEEWRKIEGLPIRAAYVVEKLGHTSVIEVVRK